MCRVIVLDDDKIQLFIIKKILGKSGRFNDTLYTDDGKKVLDFLIKHISEEAVLPQLLFLDLNMPILNGWEFLNRLALVYDDLKRPLAVYILSSSIDPRDIKRSHKYNFIKSYLIKPVSVKTMEDIIKDVE
ncbi:response regulator [Mucilaginibacter celer]|uniref:Response regulator n=1 Tax=Mucilaginibacter celer TaxID=2305508 RepID=A0A494VJK9_9SPHI|nr:response regulator [Mucilaginibacter celer]AYL95246.1 response regulator [Mucilaginibacter celer]